MKRLCTMVFFTVMLIACGAASALGADAQSYFDSATRFYNDGKFADAVREYGKVISLAQDRSEPYYYRGKAYYNLHQYDEAIDDFNKALSIRPAFVEAYASRGFAYLKKAEADYKKACDMGEKNSCDNLKQLSEQ